MPLHLLDLPVELLESILFYVPPSLLITRVGATCRQLRDLLQSESFWKRRYVALVYDPAPLQESWQYWHRGCVQYAFTSRLVRGEGAMHIKALTGRQIKKIDALAQCSCVDLAFNSKTFSPSVLRDHSKYLARIFHQIHAKVFANILAGNLQMIL